MYYTLKRCTQAQLQYGTIFRDLSSYYSAQVIVHV